MILMVYKQVSAIEVTDANGCTVNKVVEVENAPAIE